MVHGAREAVRALVVAGKSLDEAIAAKPTAPWDKQWGGGFIKPEVFVKMLYRLEGGVWPKAEPASP